MDEPTPRSTSRPRSSITHQIVLFLLLAAGAVVLLNWQALPTGSASGTSIHDTPTTFPADRTTFRAAIFNIHSGIGTDDVLNLQRTADALKDTDVCAINEARGRLFGTDANQVHDLSDLAGRAWLYMPVERRFWHDAFGNGILTRIPVSSWMRMPLPADGSAGGYRNMTLARLDLGGRTVNLLVSHVNPLAIQPAQIRALSTMFLSLNVPALLLADTNCDLNQTELKALLQTPGVHSALGETIGDRPGRVDWIIARGLKVKNGGKVENNASDHAMFWADLELE